MSRTDDWANDYHWDRLQEDQMRRADELERLAERLVEMLNHELAGLPPAESDLVKSCMRDLGW